MGGPERCSAVLLSSQLWYFGGKELAFHFAGKACSELAPGDLNRKSKVSGGQAIAKRLQNGVEFFLQENSNFHFASFLFIQSEIIPEICHENNSKNATSEIILTNCVLRDDQVSRMIKRRDRPSTFCCWPIEQKMYFSRWWEKGFWCHRTATKWSCWIRMGHWLL